jgi:uncharacterized protein with HEPN domain
MRSDRDRLADINQAIQRILEKLPADKDEFTKSDLLQVWIPSHIQIIGEAANGISQESRKKHQDIPWKDIIAMRHLLVHQYFGIDLDEVWNTTQQDLPRLKKEIDRMLNNG